MEEPTVFPFIRTVLFYPDCEKLGKSTSSFCPTLKRTLTILRVNKHFWGGLCPLVLFNDVKFIAVISLIVD